MPIPFPPLITQPNQFPEYDPKHDHYDGLVCLTTQLSPPFLLAAYARGLFPWHEEDGVFYWFATHPRAILLPEHLRINRSLAKTLRRCDYRITLNHAFSDVIMACATQIRAGQDGTWIGKSFPAAYMQLHQLGNAHSVEVWQDNQLIGGLYGVQIGSVFFGESMFSHRANASKVALARAIPYLSDCGIKMIDCQQNSPHMQQLGAVEVDFADFRRRLEDLASMPLKRAIECVELG